MLSSFNEMKRKKKQKNKKRECERVLIIVCYNVKTKKKLERKKNSTLCVHKFPLKNKKKIREA